MEDKRFLVFLYFTANRIIVNEFVLTFYAIIANSFLLYIRNINILTQQNISKFELRGYKLGEKFFNKIKREIGKMKHFKFQMEVFLTTQFLAIIHRLIEININIDIYYIS